MVNELDNSIQYFFANIVILEGLTAKKVQQKLSFAQWLMHFNDHHPPSFVTLVTALAIFSFLNCQWVQGLVPSIKYRRNIY